MPVLYRVQVRTHTGIVRDVNEDTVSTVLDWRASLGLDDEELRTQGHLFAVADGMGGHAAGEIASQLAVATLFRTYYGDEGEGSDIRGLLADAIMAANDAVCVQADRNEAHAGMGTTLVAAVLQGAELTIANVGDSRAYHFRRQQLTQVTRDHSWVAEQKAAGVLSREEAARHPYRNVVTHSLGPDRDPSPDFFQLAIQPADRLLLCSDGLSNVIDEGEIAAILHAYPADEAADILLERTLERGAPDNVTLALVEFVGDVETGRRPRWVWLVGGVLALAVAAVAFRQPLSTRFPILAPAAATNTPTPSPSPSPTVEALVGLPVADALQVAEIELPIVQAGTPAPDPMIRFGRTAGEGEARRGRPLPDRYVYFLTGPVESIISADNALVLTIAHRSRDASIHRYVLTAPGTWIGQPPAPGDTVAVVARPVVEDALTGDITLEPFGILAHGPDQGTFSPLWLFGSDPESWLNTNAEQWVFTAYGDGGGEGLGLETPANAPGAPVALWGGWQASGADPDALVFQSLDAVPYELENGVYRQPDN